MAAGLFSAACADADVGLPIPADQLYYPFGIQSFRDGGDGGQRLLILSTNFDLRFQSGQVSLVDADRLVDGVLAQLGISPSVNPCDPRQFPPDRLPFFSVAFDFSGPAFLSRVRVPGIGGELLGLPVSNPDRIYVTDRIDGEIILVRRDGSRLFCSREGDDAVDKTDCSSDFVTISEAEEPYSLASGSAVFSRTVTSDTGSTETRTVILDYLAVGHLFDYDDGFSQFGVVTFFDEAQLVGRSEGGASSPYLGGLRLRGAGGVSGLGFTPFRPRGGAVLAMPLRTDPPRANRSFALSSVELFPAGQSAEEGQELVPVRADVLPFDSFSNASSSRGLALNEDRDRALISLRFDQPGAGFSAGLGYIRIDGDALTPLPILEVGEELGPPAFRPRSPGGPLLAYVGDLRLDKVWIVDATREVPRVVGEIDGRAPRTLDDGRVIDARTLDGPIGIAFTERNERVYAFVANFAGSTLSILDVSDDLPQRHCLIARIGQDVDANGQSEIDRQ